MFIMCLYVDDTITASHPEDHKEAEELINKIKTQFKIKDLGEPKALLGTRIQIDPKNGTITLDQPNYIEKILSKFNIDKSKGNINTPDVKEVDEFGQLSYKQN